MQRKKNRTAVRVVAVTAATVLLAGVLLLARSPKTIAPEAANGPTHNGPAECVARMIASQKAGDVQPYLDRFSGQLRDKLQRRLTATDVADPSAELRATASGLTGYVTTGLQVDGDSAALVLERIYRQYNERHQVRLRNMSGSWRIVELEPKDRFAPQIPYGTPAFVPPKQQDRAKQ